MALHQIQVTYSAEEDRILYRASFKEEDDILQEVRAWLTRRMVTLFWSGIVDVLEKQVLLDKPHAAHASADIVSMEHESTVGKIKDSGNFNNAYETDSATYPLGEAPILVATIKFALNPNQPVRIDMMPATGRGFEIAFTQQVLHGFCALLKDAVRKAEWNMELTMPGTVLHKPALQMLN